MIRSEDLRRIPDDAWTLTEVTPTHRVYQCRIDEKTIAQKREFLADDELIAANKQSYDDSFGKRFGDGKVIASVPLSVLYDPENQVFEKMRQGDTDHMKFLLNSEKWRPYRTFRGNV